MKSTDPRHSVEWQRLRKQIIAAARSAGLPCAHCGLPIDWTASGRTPLGPSVDHTYALALNPELAFEPGLLRVLHTRCNARLGGRLGRARQLGKARLARRPITANRW
jgi:5-methylcytosine-specific restriction endonuclease McrA